MDGLTTGMDGLTTGMDGVPCNFNNPLEKARHKYAVFIQAKQIEKAKLKKDKYDDALQKEKSKISKLSTLSYKQYFRTDNEKNVRKEGIHKRKTYLHRRAYEHRSNNAKQNIKKLEQQKTVVEMRKEMAKKMYNTQKQKFENTNSTIQRQKNAAMFMENYAQTMQLNNGKNKELTKRLQQRTTMITRKNDTQNNYYMLL